MFRCIQFSALQYIVGIDLRSIVTYLMRFLSGWRASHHIYVPILDSCGPFDQRDFTNWRAKSWVEVAFWLRRRNPRRGLDRLFFYPYTMIFQRRFGNTLLASFLVLLMPSAVASEAAAENAKDDGCAGGFCPNSKPSSGSCNYWLGPSPIKKEEEHGFGLGFFTGKAIPKGTAVESVFYGKDKSYGEPIIPILGNDDMIDRHPPLFEALWNEENVPELAVQYPDTFTVLFTPGLGAIAPCTSHGYNLVIKGKGNVPLAAREAAVTKTSGVHRSSHFTAGSFSYYPNLQFEVSQTGWKPHFCLTTITFPHFFHVITPHSNRPFATLLLVKN